MKKMILVFVLCMAYCGGNVTSASDNLQRWIPVVFDDSNWSGFLFVVNVSDVEVVSVTLTGYYASGSKIGEHQFTLGTRQGKIISLFSQPFGATVTDPRISVKMTMDRNTVLLTAVSVSNSIETRNDLLLFQSVLGNTTETVAPFLTNLSPYESYLGVVNTLSGRGSVTCNEYNSGGSLAVDKTYSLNAQAMKYGTQVEIFPGYRNEGWGDFSDTGTTLAGSFIYYNDTYKRTNYSSAPMSGQSLSRASFPLGAFLVNSWKSHLILTNPTSSYGKAKVSAWHPGGYIVGNERTFTVPPNGYAQVDIDNNTFSNFLPDDGVYSLEITTETTGMRYLLNHITYEDLSFADIVPAPVAPADSAAAQAPAFANTADYSTWVALKNTGTSSDLFRLRAYDYSGNLIEEKTMTLYGHASSFTDINKLLPKTSGQSGWLEFKPTTAGRTVAMQTVYINKYAGRLTYSLYTSNVD